MEKSMALIIILSALCLLTAYSGSTSAITLTLSASSADVDLNNSIIKVTYTGVPGNQGDTIFMFKRGDNKYISRQLLNGSQNGALTFAAPLEPGTYYFALYADGTSLIKVSNLVNVHNKAKLSVSPVVVDFGDFVRVSYSGAPGYQRDWIGLHEEGAPEGEFICRQYLNGTSSGTLTFPAPREPGTYDFRMFMDGTTNTLGY